MLKIFAGENSTKNECLRNIPAFTLAEIATSDGRRVVLSNLGEFCKYLNPFSQPSPVSEDMEPAKPKAYRRNYPSTKKLRLVKAFTLAEVLLALGIIGVVAVLTVPNLLHNKENKDLVSRYLKTNTTISNAYKNGEALKGEGLYKLTPEQFKSAFEDDLHIIRSNCDKDVCLADGSTLEYVCDETCTEIIADTNGKKGPNTAGKDRFKFLISENGIKPLGEYSDYCGEVEGGMDCGRYILANHKLFDGLVNNCANYTDGRCSTCEDGYSLEGNTCDAVNLPNCDRYSGITCSTCKAGYMLKNGTCSSLAQNNCSSTTDGENCDVCANKFTNKNGTCEEIEIADCKTYSGDS